MHVTPNIVLWLLSSQYYSSHMDPPWLIQLIFISSGLPQAYPQSFGFDPRLLPRPNAALPSFLAPRDHQEGMAGEIATTLTILNQILFTLFYLLHRFHPFCCCCSHHINWSPWQWQDLSVVGEGCGGEAGQTSNCVVASLCFSGSRTTFPNYVHVNQVSLLFTFS